MKTSVRILIAILVLLVPLAGRTLWFYQGVYQRSEPVATPPYAELGMQEPTLSTPVPVKAAPAANAPVVVLDMAHYNYVYLSEIDKLTNRLEKLGAKLEIYDGSYMLSEHLKYATSFITIAPTSAFTTFELRNIQQFVDRGGHVLVITDPTRNYGYASSVYNSVEVSNLLLAPFEISFNDDYVYNLVTNESNFRNVIYKDIQKSPVTEGISSVVFYSAHSLKTTQTVLIRGDKDTLTSINDTGGGLAVAASAAEGKVVALGDMSFIYPPYDQVADNQTLLDNLATFLSGATRSLDLKNFPYLFSRPVTILLPKGDTISPDLLSALGTAQSMFEAYDFTAQMASEPQDGNDLLIMSNLPLRTGMEKYLKPFKLEFSKEPQPTATPQEFYEESTGEVIEEAATPDPNFLTPTPYDESGFYGDYGGYVEETKIPMLTYVTVPGFGKLDTAGLGLVLFDSSAERNTLVLLAGNEADLSTFASMLSSGSLAGCVVQQNIAVCKLSSSSSGYGY